jgi:N-methylhydantoinase A
LPTVTDAHLVLGHFGGAGLLGGEFPLDQNRAQQAVNKLARAMSQAAGRKVTAIEAAQGVVTIANTNMERALRRISVERGFDTRDFALLPFGGAGGLHAVDLARALRIPRIIAPQAAGALSAIGVLTADVVKDQSRTTMLEYSAAAEKKLDQIFKELERDAFAVLRAEGFSRGQQRHERSLGVRYKGQSFELTIKQTRRNIAKEFHHAHRERYGYAQEGNVVEIVSARLRSVGLVQKVAAKKLRSLKAKGFAKASKTVDAFIDGKKFAAAVYERSELLPSAKLRSPCIVTEYSSTTLIPPGSVCVVDDFGNLIIHIKA